VSSFSTCGVWVSHPVSAHATHGVRHPDTRCVRGTCGVACCVADRCHVYLSRSYRQCGRYARSAPHSTPSLNAPSSDTQRPASGTTPPISLRQASWSKSSTWTTGGCLCPARLPALGLLLLVLSCPPQAAARAFSSRSTTPPPQRAPQVPREHKPLLRLSTWLCGRLQCLQGQTLTASIRWLRSWSAGLLVPHLYCLPPVMQTLFSCPRQLLLQSSLRP